VGAEDLFGEARAVEQQRPVGADDPLHGVGQARGVHRSVALHHPGGGHQRVVDDGEGPSRHDLAQVDISWFSSRISRIRIARRMPSIRRSSSEVLTK
jgi:hypothetical protein